VNDLIPGEGEKLLEYKNKCNRVRFYNWKILFRGEVKLLKYQNKLITVRFYKHISLIF